MAWKDVVIVLYRLQPRPRPQWISGPDPAAQSAAVLATGHISIAAGHINTAPTPPDGLDNVSL